MTDLNAEVPSTVIDNDAPAPGAAEYRPEAIEPEAAPEKPMSLEDAVKQAASETKDKADKPEVEAKAKPEPKAKVESKPEPEAKPEPKSKARESQVEETPETSEGNTDEAETVRDGEAKRSSEGRDDQPPSRFLPRAKEAWASAAPELRSEVKRMEAEFLKGTSEYKESHEKWSALKEFDAEAKAAGTTVPDYIKNVRAIEKLIASNPVEGIKRVLATAGISPEQYARHVLGQAEQERANPQAAQNNQVSQQVQQLQQQIREMNEAQQKREEEARIAAVADKFITPFKADHPRYDELENDIAFFLNSGKIPSNLSERDRLEEAYDMAVRINPDGRAETAERLKPAPDDRPLNPAGRKSVKGSLSFGAEVPRKSAKLSLDEAIKMAARSVRG